MQSVDRSPAGEQEAGQIQAALSQWYAAHPSIRRLWAIEDAAALIVLVALEPTADGDDTLPIWLGRQQTWANHLKSLANRDVQFNLTVSGAFEAPHVNADAVVITELNWRETWLSS